MTTPNEYAREPFVTDEGPRLDMSAHARPIAHAWVAQAVDPAQLELLAELVARAARELDEDERRLQRRRTLRYVETARHHAESDPS